MYHPIYDGRLTADLGWLKERSKRLQEGPTASRLENHSAALERVAQVMGYGPRNYNDAHEELLRGVTAAAVLASELSRLQLPDWLELVGQDEEGKDWFLLSPDKVEGNPAARKTVESIGFDFWALVSEPSGPLSVYAVHVEQSGIGSGYLVAGTSALQAIDSTLFRLRCPRPWRLSDYRGETKNELYASDRLGLGLFLETRIAAPKNAAHSFARFCREWEVDSRALVELLEVNDEIMDAASEADFHGITDFEGQRGLVESMESLASSLHHLVDTLEEHYESSYSPALPYFESARYVHWALERTTREPGLMTAGDLLYITMIIQAHLRQLAAPFSPLIETQRSFAYPPNALTLPNGTEAGAIVHKRSRKRRNPDE
jgi:hypothetical protein